MSENMEVETEEVETATEATAVDTGDKEHRVNDFFDNLQNKPAETETVEADADAEQATEAQEETPVAQEPAKVEGPTAAMRLVAKQHGLSEKLISTFTSDDQLSVFLEELGAATQEKKPEPEQIAVPEFKVEFPEDEFPADDPVRKNIEGLASEFKSQVDKIYGYMNQMADLVIKSDETRASIEYERLALEQGAFDKHFDSFEHGVLGNRAAGLTSDQQEVREAIYAKYHKLKTENPDGNDTELYNRAAAPWGLKPKTQTRMEAIREQSDSRLGGKPSRPVAPREPSKSERLDALFNRLDANHKK